MAQIKDILKIESERTEENRLLIHLFQEGSFYRAYEWSAWLCHRFVSQFKVTHKKLKSIEPSVLFVGFPVTSLDKYFASMPMGDAGEKEKDVLLPVDTLPEGMSLDIMHTDFETWKASIPLSEPNTQSKEYSLSRENRAGTADMRRIMHEILAFPVEQKTPIECMLFVAETKRKLALLL